MDCRIAMVAITRRGAGLLARLGPELPDADLFVDGRFLVRLEGLPNDTAAIEPPLRTMMGRLFRTYDQLVLLFAAGAAVRLIAPHLRSKTQDPGVVVIDDAGDFAVPILSGHRGGANALARRLAGLTGGQPVITTAADVLGTLAVDMLGRSLGWRIDAPERNLTRAAACLVNGEPVALIQECGSTAWRDGGTPLPENITRFERFEQLDPDGFCALLWITWREVPPSMRDRLGERLVLYRPPARVVLGVGCDRGTPLATIETALEQALGRVGLGRDSVTAIATIDKKSDEPGLLALAEDNGWPLHFYTAQELARVAVPNPSDVVMKYMGTPSVGEAAALLLAGAGMERLIVEKHKYRGADGRNATLSIVPLETEAC